MVNDPANSHGFSIALQNESYYRRLVFASSDNMDPTKHPKLEVTYNPAIGILERENSSAKLEIYPNPSNGLVTVSIERFGKDAAPIEIYRFSWQNDPD